MNILSLFDGISCARVALERAGIPVTTYFASEVDKYAIQVALKNYPDIYEIGDVRSISGYSVQGLMDVDLLIGGSPCQDLSIAKRDRKGLDGSRSGLFWEYVRILHEAKPKYFILENVASMPKEAKQIITDTLGVEPIMIDAALVSAQRRKRLFWTNIPGVQQPTDRGIYLKDIIIDGIAERDKSLCVTSTYMRACPRDYFGKSSRQLIKVGEFNQGGQGDRIYSIEGKSVTLSALGGGRGAKTGLYETNLGICRKLHPIECERLQGLPEIEQSCIIRVCKDNQKNPVVVEILNPKSQNAVGNVGRGESKGTAKAVEKNLNTNSQPTNKLVQADVSISCSESSIEIYNQNKLLLSANGVGNTEAFRHLKSIEDFVHLAVGLNTIVEKTMPFGEVESPQKSSLLVVKESGNNVVSIFGKGITQLVEDVRNDLITLNKLLKSTTSDLSIQENKEQIIQTLFSYVALAILGFIPKEIQNQNTLTFQIKSKIGYTNGVSNSQRYKMLGNAFNVDVVAHILSFLPKTEAE